MKKIIIGGLVLGALILAYFVGFHPSTQSAQNDATIDSITQDATALEAELSALSASVSNNTLSPEAAVAAHGRIQSKLASIEQAYQSADTFSMSKAQRDAMIDSLSSIKNVLTSYQSTLVAVDTVAARKMGRSFPGSITTKFIEVVESADDSVDEVLPEYEATDVDLDVETEVFIDEIEIDMEDTAEVDATNEEHSDIDSESTDMEADTETNSDEDADVSGTFDADNIENIPSMDDEEISVQ